MKLINIKKCVEMVYFGGRNRCYSVGSIQPTKSNWNQIVSCNITGELILFYQAKPSWRTQLRMLLCHSLLRILVISSTRLKLFSSIAMVIFHHSPIQSSFCFSQLFLNLRISYMLPGVIWKGDKLIDGVSQTLDMLRSKVLVASLSLWFFVFFF